MLTRNQKAEKKNPSDGYNGRIMLKEEVTEGKGRHLREKKIYFLV